MPLMYTPPLPTGVPERNHKYDEVISTIGMLSDLVRKALDLKYGLDGGIILN